MSRHQRRLQVLKVKRGKMTSDEMIIDLFAETADNTMSSLV